MVLSSFSKRIQYNRLVYVHSAFNIHGIHVDIMSRMSVVEHAKTFNFFPLIDVLFNTSNANLAYTTYTYSLDETFLK